MISACLLGIHCRYDGGHSLCPDLADFATSVSFIVFCPEQLGGLPTPRSPANISGGDGCDILSGGASVMNVIGEDVTDSYRKGAEVSRIGWGKHCDYERQKPFLWTSNTVL